MNDWISILLFYSIFLFPWCRLCGHDPMYYGLFVIMQYRMSGVVFLMRDVVKRPFYVLVFLVLSIDTPWVIVEVGWRPISLEHYHDCRRARLGFYMVC
jgi:hypothetical protein